MRRVVIMAAVLLLGLAACGDDAGETTISGSATTSELPPATFDVSACPEPAEIGTASELIDLLGGIGWDVVGPYASGSGDAPSGDVVVVGSITIEGTDVPLTADCLSRDDCRHVAAFAGSLPGVDVEGSESWFEGEPRLTLTDVRVRLSALMIDTHPGPYNFVPLVSVSEPCGTPCEEGQLACQADLTCHHSYESYCRYCEGRPAAECACHKVTGPRPDGTTCEYFVSGDVIEVGTCESGRCEIEQ